MSPKVESQAELEAQEKIESAVREVIAEKKGKKSGRGRVFSFIAYDDSSLPGWQERLQGRHVRGFISPCHDRDVCVDGSLKKKHWHIMLFYDGKKSIEQVNKLREEVFGPDFNRAYEEIECPGAYARYLVHMDNPEKAQYRKEDVVCLGGADYDIAASMPGDDATVMAEMSAYIVSADITSVNSLIAVCKEEGRKDWLNYISRRGYVIGMMIGHNIKRLSRLRDGMPLPGDKIEVD